MRTGSTRSRWDICHNPPADCRLPCHEQRVARSQRMLECGRFRLLPKTRPAALYACPEFISPHALIGLFPLTAWCLYDRVRKRFGRECFLHDLAPVTLTAYLLLCLLVTHAALVGGALLLLGICNMRFELRRSEGLFSMSSAHLGFALTALVIACASSKTIKSIAASAYGVSARD